MRHVLLTNSRRPGNWTRPRAWSSKKWAVFNLVTRHKVYAFAHSSRWGICLFAVTTDGERYKQWPWLNGIESLPVITRKKKRQEPAEVDLAVNVETKVFAKQMGLVHHCSVLRYGPEEPRVPGNITIATQGISWIVFVNDPDSCHRLKVVAATLDAALAGANTLVQQEDAPWEYCKWMEPDAPRRRKK